MIMNKTKVIICCEYNKLVDTIISQILDREDEFKLSGIISINDLPNNNKNLKSLLLGDHHDIINKIKNNFDIILLIGYPFIIPKNILDKYICINSHASLLPQYRGFHSTGWALINNEPFVGYTIHIAESTFDTGSIIYQYKIKTTLKTTFRVVKKSIINDMKINFVPVLSDYLHNKIKPISQPLNMFPKISSKRSIRECFIDWNQKSIFIERFIRSLLPPEAPGAFTIINNRKLIITKSSLYNCETYYGTPGKVLIVSEKAVLVKTLDKALWVHRVIYNDVEQNANQVISKVGIFLGIDLIAQVLENKKI